MENLWAAMEKIRADHENRLNAIYKFLWEGNGESVAVSIAAAQKFAELAERFIMAHEKEHKQVNDQFAAINKKLDTAKGWLLAVVMISGLLGFLIDLSVRIYFLKG